jgi:hypothetical protein
VCLLNVSLRFLFLDSEDSEIEIVTADYWERPSLEALAYRTTGSHRHTTRRHVTTPRRTHPPTTPRPRTTTRRTHPPTTPRPRTTTRRPRPPTTTRYVIRTTRPPTTTRRPSTTTRRPPRPPTTTRRPPTTTRWPTRPPTTTRRPHTTTRWPPRPPTTTRRLPTTTTRRKTPTLGKTNVRWNDLPPRPGSGLGSSCFVDFFLIDRFQVVDLSRLRSKTPTTTTTQVSTRFQYNTITTQGIIKLSRVTTTENQTPEVESLGFIWVTN